MKGFNITNHATFVVNRINIELIEKRVNVATHWVGQPGYWYTEVC